MITLTQLEYIVAIDEYRHFATVVEKCFVTQPTLSMQIKKLEMGWESSFSTVRDNLTYRPISGQN